MTVRAPLGLAAALLLSGSLLTAMAAPGLAQGQTRPNAPEAVAEEGAEEGAVDPQAGPAQERIEGAIVIDPRTGQPRVLNAPPPEDPSDARARARQRAAERAAEEGLDPDADPDLSLEAFELDPDGLRAGAPIPEPEPAPSVPGVRVVLRGLDKLTGDLGEAEADVGGTASLWRLEIDVEACYAQPEASSSSATAFLQIRDTKPEPAETVFSGWMFAASPALSAMDHPRYDVWVLSCSVS